MSDCNMKFLFYLCPTPNMQTITKKRLLWEFAIPFYLSTPFPCFVRRARSKPQPSVYPALLALFHVDAKSCFGWLPSSMSTVNTEIASRHEAAGVAKQEYGSTAIFLGDAKSLKHVLLGPLFLSLGVVVEQVQQHLSQDVSGRECVDADAILTPLSSQASGKLDNGGLGGVICSLSCTGQTQSLDRETRGMKLTEQTCRGWQWCRSYWQSCRCCQAFPVGPSGEQRLEQS